MRVQLKTVALVSILGAVAGCAHLVSVHYDPLQENPPAGSYPYALTESMVNVIYTVVLTACGTTSAPADHIPSIGVSVTATITPGFGADPDQYFYLPTKHLTGVMKTTSIKVTTASDGTLQALNSEMADQTLQVAGAAAQTVASLAGDVLTGGVKVPAISTHNPLYARKEPTDEEKFDAKLKSSACTSAAQHNFYEYSSKKSALASATAPADPGLFPLPSASAGNANAPDAQKNGQRHTDNQGTDPAATPPKSASDADAALAYKTTQVSDALKKITLLVPVTIVPKAADFAPVSGQPTLTKATYPIDLLRYIRAFWIDPTIKYPIRISFNEQASLIKCLHPDDLHGTQNASTCTSPSTSTASYHDVAINVYAVRSTTAAPLASAPNVIPPQPLATNDPDADTKRNIDGIVLRQPAAGFVRTCLIGCQDPDDQGVMISMQNSANADLATNTPLTIPQLGKRIRIPLHTHVGDDVSISATLATDGSPTVLSLNNTSTLAQGLTAATGAATAYSGAVTAQNTAITAQNGAVSAQSALTLSNAQMADNKLKAQADCMMQQATIVKAGGTPVTACQ